MAIESKFLEMYTATKKERAVPMARALLPGRGLHPQRTAAEIGRFARVVSDDFDFTSMTYQELPRG